MTSRFEQILKYLPAITLLCYICGVITFNTFLLQFGIIDSTALNIRYIEAGSLFLILALFVLATPLIISKEIRFLGSISTALFAFYMYNMVFGNMDFSFLWKAAILVIVFNSLSYSLIRGFRTDTSENNFDLTESPLKMGVIVISATLAFGIYFKEIKSNFGGGKSYNKILILKERKDGIIISDSLLHTDTLEIVYENSDFIYFLNRKSVMSIRRNLIDGEIMVR